MSTFLFDTFNGTGNLSTHLATPGGAWAISYVQGSTALTDIILVGDGSIKVVNGGGISVYAIDAAVTPATSFAMEIDYVLTNRNPSLSEVGVFAKCTEVNADTGDTCSVNVGVFAEHSGGIEIDWHATSVHEQTGGSNTTISTYGIPQILRMEVSADRRSFKFLLNGTVFDTWTLDASMPEPVYLGFFIHNLYSDPAVGGGVSVSVSRVQGTDITPLGFWTNRIKTDEFDSL